MTNVYKLYDELSSEPYARRAGKPVGFERCSYCDNYYEPETYETTCSGGEGPMMTVCKSCGEVGFVYNEE